MKAKAKLILSILIIFILTLVSPNIYTVQAYKGLLPAGRLLFGKTTQSGDYEYYTLEDGTIAIAKYNGSEKSVTLPITLDGKKCVALANGAFEDNSEIVSVTIPEGYFEIEAYAFSDCSNLERINIPQTVIIVSSVITNDCPKVTYEIPIGLEETSWGYKKMDEVTITGTNYNEYVKEIVDLVNKERTAVGINPVTVDKGLCEESMIRAAEITLNFSHDRPCVDSYSRIIENVNVDGENIAYTHGLSSEYVMALWMNSSGHKARILTKRHKSVGVGIYKSPDSSCVFYVLSFSDDEAKEDFTKTQQEIVTQKVKVAFGYGIARYDLYGLEKENVLNVGETMSPTDAFFNNSKIQLTDLHWKSSNTNVFTVSNSGEITAKGIGEATLTVSLADYIKTYKIIVKAAPTATPTTKPTASPTAKPIKYMLGDVTNDKKITTEDALKVLRYSIGLENFSQNQKIVADVNKDKKINTKDASMILRYTIGLKDF